MMVAMRIGGWGLFVIGFVVFVAAGAFSPDPGNKPIAFAGLMTVLLGMFLTSTSRLIGHFAEIKRLKEKVSANNAFKKQAELKPVEKPPSQG